MPWLSRFPLPIISAAIALMAAACRTPVPEDTAAADGIPAAEPALENLLPGDLPPLDPNLLPDSLPEYLPGEELLPSDGLDPMDSGPAAGPGGWLQSGVAAIQQSRQTEKPLVLWLANTAAGPLDNLLGAEALHTPEMEKRLRESAIGLKIDYAGDTVNRSPYYQAFRKRFNPKGYPAVLILMPDGTEVVRRTGYSKGTAEGWLDRFDADLKRANEAWKKRKDDLAKAGFRNWTDRHGVVVFAKALRRDATRATLIDPFRRVFRIPLDRFSHECLVDLLDGLPDATKAKE